MSECSDTATCLFLKSSKNHSWMKYGAEETGGYDWSDRRVSVAAGGVNSVSCCQYPVSPEPGSWSLHEIPGLVYRGSLVGYLCILKSMLVGTYWSSPKESAWNVRLLSHRSHQAVLFSGPVERILVSLLVCDLGEVWEAFALTRKIKDTLCSSLLLRL